MKFGIAAFFALMGLGILATSGWLIFSALRDGYVPSKFDGPRYREDNPENFWATITVFGLVGLIGLAMLAAGPWIATSPLVR